MVSMSRRGYSARKFALREPVLVEVGMGLVIWVLSDAR